MYDKVEVEAYNCRCEKCGHTWISYKTDIPTHCANRKCSNPTKWNQPGRSRTYAVGKSVSVNPTETVANDFDFGA
jgi:hypothetical protein